MGLDTARQLRIEYEETFYHITSRGNQREKIFWDTKDRERLKAILERTQERYGYLFHGYVLMNNHYHLLIETPLANIKQIMQNVNTSYTVFVNRKYNRSGHLFQGRYKGFIVDKDRYLLALSRYIHLNPVRAGAVKRAEEYQWSSYREYLYGSVDGALTDMDETLSFFSKHRAVAVRKYKEFVEAGIRAKTPLGDVAESILGGRTFRERVHGRFAEIVGPWPDIESTSTTVTTLSTGMESRGSASITRRPQAHPFGFIADIELTRCSLISAFGPSPLTN